MEVLPSLSTEGEESKEQGLLLQRRNTPVQWHGWWELAGARPCYVSLGSDGEFVLEKAK